MVDVGGGSTELVLGAPEGVAWSRSLQAGCVRMTERFLGEDVVAERDFAACGTVVAELLDVVPRGGRRGDAARDRRRRHRDDARRDPARRLRRPRPCTARASRARTGARAAARAWRPCRSSSAASVPGLEPARAPVIVAGLVVLGCVLDRFGLGEAIVSERDILHGAALLAASSAISA